MGNICSPPNNNKSNVDGSGSVSSRVAKSANSSFKKTDVKPGTPPGSPLVSKVPVSIEIKDYEKKKPWTPDSEVLSLIKDRVKRKDETDSNIQPKNKQEEIAFLFDRLDKWEFPILELEELTNSNPLVYLMYALFVKYDLFKKFNLDEPHLIQFFTRLQELYYNIPYHNATHAAQTVHSFHYMIRRGLNQYFSDEDIFAAIIAASAIHASHPGLDNNYQANSESHVATLYNDINILENHSSTTLFELIQEFDLLKTFTKEQKPELRELIIEMILSTDVTENDKYVSAFKQKVESSCEFSNREDIRNILQVTLKLCDWSHFMKGSKVYKEFTRRLMTEMFNQGDLEKAEDLPSATENDRSQYSDTLPKHQIMIMDKYIKPPLKLYIEILPKLKFLLTAVRKNHKYWMTSFEEQGNSDFPDHCFDRIEIAGAQSQFNTEVSTRPIPDDQDKVIPIEEQNEKRPKPNDHDKEIESQCVEQVRQRFDSEKSSSYTLPDGDAPIYSIVDFKTHPFDELKDEERRNSILKIFDRIDEWNFDVFTLSRLLQSHAMFITSWALFERHDLIRQLKIDSDHLSNFLREVQDGYQMNPYHNAMHACDVMQVTHSIITKGDMIKQMSKIDIVAAIVSSMVHDLDHPGLNNAYQVHSNSYLATIYNDRSVLENHHCAQTFKLIRSDEKYNIFSGMSKEEQRDARLTMVSMIISTDMTNHGAYIKKFNARIEAGSDFKSKDDIRIALQIAIKMADVSNPSRPLYLYLQWTDMIITEFFLQGDKERDNNLPVSPLMDRHSSVLSKGQIAFMQYVIIPMFNSFATVFPGMKFVLKLINSNKAYWETHSSIDERDYDPNRKTVENDE